MTTTFTHAGLDWHPHIPGDHMPCPGDTLVRVLMRGELNALCDSTNYETSASIWDWDVCPAEPMAEIVGWHPIEEQPEWPNAYTTVETGILRRVFDLLEAGDIEQAKHELRKELE